MSDINMLKEKIMKHKKYIYVILILFLLYIGVLLILNKPYEIQLPNNISNIILLDFKESSITKKSIISKKENIVQLTDELKNSSFVEQSSSFSPYNNSFKIILITTGTGYTFSYIYENKGELFYEQPFYGIFRLNKKINLNELINTSIIMNEKVDNFDNFSKYTN